MTHSAYKNVYYNLENAQKEASENTLATPHSVQKENKKMHLMSREKISI